jgi:hypothetical protein
MPEMTAWQARGDVIVDSKGTMKIIAIANQKGGPSRTSL